MPEKFHVHAIDVIEGWTETGEKYLIPVEIPDGFPVDNIGNLTRAAVLKFARANGVDPKRVK